MERGIITVNGKLKRVSVSGVTLNSSLSIQEISYYLLYWDRIVMPTNNIFHMELDNEKFLIDSGILARPRVVFPSWSSDLKKGSFNPISVAHAKIANHYLSREDNIDWVIHQMGDEIIIDDSQKMEFNSIKFKIMNCLPVPIEKFNYEEILKFKEKRIDELGSLRSSIDDLYLEILKTPDKGFILSKSLSDFKKSIKDLNSVSKERFKFLTGFNLTTEINFNNLFKHLGGSAILGYATGGFVFPLGYLLYNSPSVIEIKGSKTIGVENARNKNKFKLNYLASAYKNKII